MAFIRNCKQEHSHCNLIHCLSWEGPGSDPMKSARVVSCCFWCHTQFRAAQSSTPAPHQTPVNLGPFTNPEQKNWQRRMSDEENVISSPIKELSQLLQNWGEKWGGEDKKLYSPRASKNSSSELSTESLRTFCMCRWAPPNRHGPAGNTRRLTLTQRNALLCSRKDPNPLKFVNEVCNEVCVGASGGWSSWCTI